MDSIFNIILYPLDIFTTILDSTGTIPFFIGMFSIACIYRFLLKPLLGGRAISINETKVKDFNKQKSNSK